MKGKSSSIFRIVVLQTVLSHLNFVMCGPGDQVASYLNVAQNRPVTIYPTDSTCGVPAPASFCRSDDNPQSTLSCAFEACDLSCPATYYYISKPGAYVPALNSLVRGAWEKSCLTRSGLLRPGSSSSAVSAQFANRDENCYVDVDSAYLANVRLTPMWNITVDMWIYSELTDRSGMLLEFFNSASNAAVLSIYLQNRNLNIKSAGQVSTDSSWALQSSQWTHLTLSVFQDSINVYVNGVVTKSSKYNVFLSSPSTVNSLRLGQSYNDKSIGHFVGTMQDIRIWWGALSNKEIEYLYSGTLKTDGLIQPQCSCPSGTPAVSQLNTAECIANPGEGGDTSSVSRLNPASHPPEFITDGFDKTFWMSTFVGSENRNYQTNTIAILLDDIYQVLTIEIVFYSPYPKVIKYYRKSQLTESWTNWGFYSANCSVSKIDALRCINYGSIIPSSGGLIRVNLAQDDIVSTWARTVNISLEGYMDLLEPAHRYHAIYEIRIIATCACFGSGSTCQKDVSGYVCLCDPASQTQGDQCDQCAPGYYRDNVQRICRACDCNPSGVQSSNRNCRAEDGQCFCKSFVEGRRCDTCTRGYYNLSSDNWYGCQLCDCLSAGVSSGSSICDKVTGECLCKENVEGKSCNKCKMGSYALSASNPKGCALCDCDPTGSREIYSCDAQTGNCTCKELVMGRACDQCKERSYDLTKEKIEGCTLCMCDPLGSLNDLRCNSKTGQCFCKANVTGRQCNQCQPGLYAYNEAEFSSIGCTRPCACNPNGTIPDTTCYSIGGQCQCRSSAVRGRTCNDCAPLNYWTGSSLGCEACNCAPAGSITSACDINTGQCWCKRFTQLRDCSGCKVGYSGLSENNPEGCVPCQCYAAGTRNGTICDPISGQCECIPGDGDIALSGKHCDPYVAGLSPAYGPASGGTVISIKVGFFDVKGAIVYVNTQYCPLDADASRPNSLKCIVPPLESTNMDQLNKPVRVRVFTGKEFTFLNGTNNQFTYMTDPKVAGIQPLNMFESGGTAVTVVGSDLNSVAVPIIIITMIYTKNSNTTVTNFTSACERMGYDLYCRMPEIHLPFELEDITAQTNNRISGVRRKKRSINPVNSEITQFYIGVILDGITQYTNISYVKVYYNPIVNSFPEKDRIRIFKQHWPNYDKLLRIEGQRFSLGAEEKDYEIFVGNEICKIVSFTDNLIVCLPPEKEPASDGIYNIKGAPAVRVYVGNYGALPGYLDYQDSLWNDNRFKYCIIIIPIIVFVAIIVIILACIIYRKKYCSSVCKKKKADSGLTQLSEKMTTDAANPKRGNYYTPFSTMHRELSPILAKLPRQLRSKIEKCLIDKENITVDKLIGEGHFGQVYIGELTDNNAFGTWKIPVALKTIKGFDATHIKDKEVKEFLEEATIMYDLSHSNILSLVGVVLSRSSLYVVLPYMDKGDLENYISTPDNVLTVKQLVEFGLQVAYGMEYLEEENCVHRDLACRNCMINSELVVKISDFGLAHDMHGKDYYRVRTTARPLPIKWMALECLETGVFSSKSDVWSYGILLWELMTRGCVPYPEIEHKDIKEHLAAGNRLQQPSYASDQLYTIMLQCWHVSPSKRPSFSKLRKQIEQFIKKRCKRDGNATSSASNEEGQHDSSHHTYLELIADVPDYVNVKRENLKSQISSRSDCTTHSYSVDSGNASAESITGDRNSVNTSRDSCYKSFSTSTRSITASSRSRSVNKSEDLGTDQRSSL